MSRKLHVTIAMIKILATVQQNCQLSMKKLFEPIQNMLRHNQHESLVYYLDPKLAYAILKKIDLQDADEQFKAFFKRKIEQKKIKPKKPDQLLERLLYSVKSNQDNLIKN
jgi:hypothetical protein